MSAVDPASPVRLAVTGGSGFIGANAVAAAAARRVAVLNLDSRAPGAAPGLWRAVDITDAGSLAAALRGFEPTHLLHLAAKTGVDIADRSAFAANVEGTERVLRAAGELRSLRRAMFVSSLLVCRNGYVPRHDTDYCPPNAYGESKVAAERRVRKTDWPFEWIIARPTSIWGPGFAHSYRHFFRLIDRGLYVHPSRSPAHKPHSYVGNTVWMMLRLLLDAPAEAVAKRTFYLADWPETSIREWADAVQRALGARAIRTAPVWLLRVAAAAGDALALSRLATPPLTSFRLRNMLTGGRYPIAETAKRVGELPYTLEDGARATVAWMRAQGDLRERASARRRLEAGGRRRTRQGERDG